MFGKSRFFMKMYTYMYVYCDKIAYLLINGLLPQTVVVPSYALFRQFIWAKKNSIRQFFTFWMYGQGSQNTQKLVEGLQKIGFILKHRFNTNTKIN